MEFKARNGRKVLVDVVGDKPVYEKIVNGRGSITKEYYLWSDKTGLANTTKAKWSKLPEEASVK